MGDIPESITLEKNGKGTVNLLGFVSPNAYGTFVGNIEFLTEKYGKNTALIIIDSETKVIDFDATIEPLISQTQSMPGSMATFLINLYNIRNSDSRDLFLEYSLITMSGNTIMVESEKLVANTGEWTKASISKSIRIPENAAPGKYVLTLKLVSKDSTAAASTFFEVGKTLDPAFASICPTRGISCSLLIVTLILIAFFIGGYSYYYLARNIFRKIREKENDKKSVEIIILVLLAIITSFILFQLVTKTGVLQGAIGGSTEILKIIGVLVVIIVVFEIIYKKNQTIVSKIKEIISSANVKKNDSKLEKYSDNSKIRVLEKRIKIKKLKHLQEIEEDKRLEHQLWLEKRKQAVWKNKEEHKSSGKILGLIRRLFVKKQKIRKEDPLGKIERLRKKIRTGTGKRRIRY